MKKLLLFLLGCILILGSFKYLQQDVSSSKVLINKIFMHPFSDPIRSDKFTLSITGKSILKGKVTFRIINFSGKQIFKEVYNPEDLLGDMADDLTTKQKIDTIRNRMNHFFDEWNFVKPAIDPTEKYEEDEADLKIWKDIKSDTNAIGFIYSMYYESTFGIAWSRKNHKVVQFFYSD
jgi:hypothetical protein